VFGGFKFNQYIAIEGSYYDFGEIGDRSNQLEIDGIIIVAVGSIHVLPKLSLFGKIGAHDWDADTSRLIASQLNTDSGTDAFFGFGVD
jgi:OOP family OmpA-OmpF porin